MPAHLLKIYTTSLVRVLTQVYACAGLAYEYVDLNPDQTGWGGCNSLPAACNHCEQYQCNGQGLEKESERASQRDGRLAQLFHPLDSADVYVGHVL